MGLRIAKFIRTQNENLAARTIRDYPEIVFYDDADIYLCLIISFNPAELNKLLEESMKNPRTSTGILPENPFRRQILRWEFLNRWGDRQEQKEAKKYLDEAKLEAFTHFLIRGNLPGSGVSKKKVTETYKTILEDFQGFFDGESKPKYTMQKQKMLKQYIKDKKLLRYFLPFIRSDSEFDEEWKVGRIVDKLLGEDHEGNPKSESIGKKGSDRKITKINPFNPSNIALHLTGHIYNISPDTVRSIIYRS